MFSSTQLLEFFVVLRTANSIRYALSKARSAFVCAQTKSGPVRSDTMPTRLSLLISPLQGLTCFFVPMVYVLSVVGAGFHQPQWMNALAMPEVNFGVVHKSQLRVLACVASLFMKNISDSAFEHLGDQYHPIGRREKPRVVQTGPYAWVRHPLYSLVLIQGVFQCVVFWSYMPLFALVANAAVIAIKVPIEEAAIQLDDAIREEYRAYMHKVPARVVPYVW